MDKSPVLDETALVEVFGFSELATIPDLPASACKAVLAEDLELASLRNLAVALLHPDVVVAGYSMERQLKEKAAILAGKASLLRKQEKCPVEAEILQDPADQIVEMEILL